MLSAPNGFIEHKRKMETTKTSFLELRTMEDLAELLKIPHQVMHAALDRSQECYSVFYLPKRNGGHREIEAPQGDLKIVQQSLNRHLQAVYAHIRPDCAHGFISNQHKEAATCNIVTNAQVHVNTNQLLNLDLLHFFHSIDIWRVKRIFMSYPFYFGNDFASCLAILTTVGNRLPMGASSSPAISNFACFMLDRQLMRYAAEYDLKYTRYADDLTFSTSGKITAHNLQNIFQIIAAEKFMVNETKTRVQHHAGTQLVTGLKVNEKVNVDRKYIRNIRAMLNNWATHGLVTASYRNQSTGHFLNILKGKLDFLSMVRGKNDTIYLKLHKMFWDLQQQLV